MLSPWKWAIKQRKSTITLIVTIRDRVEIGYMTPIRKNTSFTNNPRNIKKPMLKPTEKETVSARLPLSNFDTFKMANPGMKVR